MVGCAEEERVCVGGGGLVHIRQITLCGLTNLTLGPCARAEGRVYFCVQPRPLPTPSSAPNPLIE